LKIYTQIGDSIKMDLEINEMRCVNWIHVRGRFNKLQIQVAT
jgi:hypothetical protein